MSVIYIRLNSFEIIKSLIHSRMTSDTFVWIRRRPLALWICKSPDCYDTNMMDLHLNTYIATENYNEPKLAVEGEINIGFGKSIENHWCDAFHNHFEMTIFTVIILFVASFIYLSLRQLMGINSSPATIIVSDNTVHDVEYKNQDPVESEVQVQSKYQDLNHSTVIFGGNEIVTLPILEFHFSEKTNRKDAQGHTDPDIAETCSVAATDIDTCSETSGHDTAYWHWPHFTDPFSTPDRSNHDNFDTPATSHEKTHPAPHSLWMESISIPVNRAPYLYAPHHLPSPAQLYPFSAPLRPKMVPAPLAMPLLMAPPSTNIFDAPSDDTATTIPPSNPLESVSHESVTYQCDADGRDCNSDSPRPPPVAM
jgi:hypothetical protein